MMVKKRTMQIFGTSLLERGNGKWKDPEACWKNSQG